jgi:hypothetical protein
MSEVLAFDPEELLLTSEPAPTLVDLSAASRNRVRRFIIHSALTGGANVESVAVLYADLNDDERANRYLDGRFMLRQVPHDWRSFEDEVLDLADAARRQGVDLASAWRRAQDVAGEPDDEDPMDALTRLAGVEVGRTSTRSIFDDPENLDEEEERTDLDRLVAFPAGRVPALHELTATAQESIRLYVVEERLERGLAPAELMELYRHLDLADDERARQYLDRVFVDGDVPVEWEALQSEADVVLDLASRRGKDAGRVFTDARRGSGLPVVDLLRTVRQQLQ